MGQKLTLVILLVLLPVFIFAAEEDSITDITEKNVYEKGVYKAGEEGNPLAVKKDEGFDFKVPEIRITGQIDTKVMLKREINLLEDFKSAKDVLYESERVYVPDYSLNDEDLMPQNSEKAADRDFVGRIKTQAGTYADILLDGTIGKVFDKDNNAVLRIFHNNYDNAGINGRNTSRNLNDFELYYKTKYDFIDTVYGVNAQLSKNINPYPDNFLTEAFNTDLVSASAGLSGKIRDLDFDALFKYDYFGEAAGGGGYIFKENRFSNKYILEQNFAMDKEREVKAVMTVDYYLSEITGYGFEAGNIFNIDTALKAIFHFEPILFQGGIKLQDHKLLGENYFRLSPYCNFSYDLTGQISAYFEFGPEMSAQDSLELLSVPYTAVNGSVKPSVESVSLKGGLNLNFFSIFFNLYGGYKSTKDALYLDEIAGQHIFAFFNKDYDCSFIGVKAETLKMKNISLKLGYEYRNILNEEAGKHMTYLPQNTLAASFVFEKSEWKLETSLKAETAQYGITNGTLPAYVDLNCMLERKINDYFTAYGYVNNLLNNNDYLLYYYKEKGLNLGLGIILNF